jgi:hypothetical protein
VKSQRHTQAQKCIQIWEWVVQIGTNGAEGDTQVPSLVSCAEVGASTTIGSDRNNASIGAAVSVGPQIGAKVGGGAVSGRWQTDGGCEMLN